MGRTITEPAVSRSVWVLLVDFPGTGQEPSQRGSGSVLVLSVEFPGAGSRGKTKNRASGVWGGFGPVGGISNFLGQDRVGRTKIEPAVSGWGLVLLVEFPRAGQEGKRKTEPAAPGSVWGLLVEFPEAGPRGKTKTEPEASRTVLVLLA